MPHSSHQPAAGSARDAPLTGPTDSLVFSGMCLFVIPQPVSSNRGSTIAFHAIQYDLSLSIKLPTGFTRPVDPRELVQPHACAQPVTLRASSKSANNILVFSNLLLPGARRGTRLILNSSCCDLGNPLSCRPPHTNVISWNSRPTTGPQTLCIVEDVDRRKQAGCGEATVHAKPAAPRQPARYA
jgi:hypothetical protein